MRNATPAAERQRRLLLARLLDQRGVGAGTPQIPRSAQDRSLLPLSFAQQRIWFFHRLAPTSAVYNVAGAARMRGPLDDAALRHCLDDVVRRHEALRTTFHLHGSRPVQRVNPPRPLTVPVHDLRGLSPTERDRAVKERLQAEVGLPFDLEHGQMLRPTLLRLADDEHLLLLVQHHIATDGWSLNILLREVGTLYEAAVRGHQPELPDLQVQYGDYADWQRAWLTGENLESQLSYWRGRLSGARLLNLPAAKAPTAARTWDGGGSSFRVSPQTMRRITDLAESEQATPYMALLAAYALVLARRSGQEDLVIGAPVANRGRPETEGIVGCFVNTLPMRMDLSGDPTFRDLLRRAREVCLGAYAHQEVPFEKIVEDVNPERDASGRTPLIRHMLGLHNMPRPSLDLPGVDIELVGVSTGKARFDLELELAPAADGGLDGLVWYAVDLFDKADVDLVTDALLAVLDAAVEAPDAPVHRLPAMGPRERATLSALSDDAVRRPAEAAVPVAAVVDGQAVDGPVADGPAVVADGVEWSHRDLRERTERLARRLKRLGATGCPVLVLQRPTPWAVATLLAVRACGAVAVPLDSSHDDEQVRAVAAGHGARFVVTDRPDGAEALAGVLRPGSAVIAPETALDEMVEPEWALTDVDVTVAAHRDLRWMADTLDEPSGGAVTLCGPRLLEDASPFLLWPPADGRTLVIAAAEPGSASHQWVPRTRRLLRRTATTLLHITPSLLDELLTAPETGLENTEPDWAAGLRRLLCAGEEPWPALVERCHQQVPGAAVYVLRRPAGCADEVIVQRLPSPAGEEPAAAAQRTGSRLRWHVLDGHGRPVPFGVPGLLHLATGGVGRGTGTDIAGTPDPQDGPGATVPDPFRPGQRLRPTRERAVVLRGGARPSAPSSSTWPTPRWPRTRNVRSAGGWPGWRCWLTNCRCDCGRCSPTSVSPDAPSAGW